MLVGEVGVVGRCVGGGWVVGGWWVEEEAGMCVHAGVWWNVYVCMCVCVLLRVCFTSISTSESSLPGIPRPTTSRSRERFFVTTVKKAWLRCTLFLTWEGGM